MIALLKLKPGISREEFARRWREDHIRLSSQLPDLRGYRSNIAGDYQPAGMGAEPLYDGTAEPWWDSFKAMDAAFGREIGRVSGAAADDFCELRIHIYTEEYIVVPGP